MHHPNSVHYLFDRDSIGWLHRRHERGEEISKEDVVRLWSGDPSYRADSILQDYVLKALKGQLKRKRGRKPQSPMRVFKLRMAEILIEDRAAEIKAERKRLGRKHEAGDLEPSIQAANEVARFLRLHMSGRSLLNAISALEE